jgi:hypothetical protein
MLINDAEITGSLIVNASSSFENIEVSGNILPGTNNIHNLGSIDKYWKEIYVSTSSINFVDNGIVTASLSANTLNALLQNTASTNDSFVSINSFTQSFSSSISTSLSQFSSSVATSFSASNASIASVTGDFSSSVAQTFITQSTNLSTLSSSVVTSFSASEASVTSLSSSTSTSFSSSAASVTSLSSSVSSSTTSLSSSLTLTNVVQNSRLGSIESKTGSYATTGSNTFFGTQTYSGSVYIANDLIVQGSSSIQYISASSVSIGTNIIQLNTANPSVRYAGLTMIDSGSIGGSGSFLYDSVQDEFIFVHRGNGINVTSSHFILGPETIDNLGNEAYLTNNRLPKGTGIEHLVDSQISDDGTTVSIGGALTVTGNITGPIRATNGVVSGSSQVDLTTTTNYASGILTRLNAVGVFSGSSQVSLSGFNTSNLSENTNLYYTDARVKTKLNAETVVSGSKTISGIALGSNLATLTIGTGLSGTSYNGSTAVTIANSGVTSIVAGTGISINQGTAAVTVTNTITNNNQLTNGAGYITSAGNAATATNLSTDRTNWSTNGTLTAVVGQLAWKNYGNNHTIIDASAGTAPNGASINATNANTVWTSSYPTLMGWNGSSTYGVRVDSARVADYATSAGTATDSSKLPLAGGTLSNNLNFSAGGINLRRDAGPGTGISWYSTTTSWTSYMSPAGTTSCGPNANITAPAGTYVTSWALRNFIEGAGGYGFTWEKGDYGGQPSVIAELRTSDGLFRTAGAIVAGGDVTAYSDGRLKENIVTITNPLDKVLRLRGVTYNRTDIADTKEKIGFIAQEVQKIIPQVVSEDSKGMLNVAYGNVTALLVEAIKEQQIKIENLTIEVENLKKPKGL